MGYHEAIKCPDGKKWKEEVRTEHGRMVQSGVFELTEYIGNKIERVGEDVNRLVQAVLMQSYEDEFELGKRCYNTPTQPGTVLMHPTEGKEVLSATD